MFFFSSFLERVLSNLPDEQIITPIDDLDAKRCYLTRSNTNMQRRPI